MLAWALGRLMAMAQESEWSRQVPRSNQSIEVMTGEGRKSEMGTLVRRTKKIRQ